MNGADSLVKTLLANGVDHCFTNPGTSEMHFVAALDQNPDMRCILCLFEGVASGAADGYARMRGDPAATLLHLGPGFANAGANVHNARRAFSPLINIVGDHATYHLPYNAPLTTDIPAVVAPFSDWTGVAQSPAEIATVGAAAVSAARSNGGQVASLILPADSAWSDSAQSPQLAPRPAPLAAFNNAALLSAADALRGKKTCLLYIGGAAVLEQGLYLAAQIQAKTGCRLMAPVSNPRMVRGAGRAAVERLPYPVDAAVGALADIEHAILLGRPEPVGFFAYPSKPSRLLPGQCRVHDLAGPRADSLAALATLAEAVGATKAVPKHLFRNDPPSLPSGPLDGQKVAQAVAAVLPEQSIVIDESISTGREFFATIRDVPPHDWLQVTGGAIGIGPPLASGAAVACPDRQVIALQADGSAMYTLQALWTQAREGLSVLTVILANRRYAILQGEMKNVGAHPGRTAHDLMSLDRPDLDWVQLARGHGVDGQSVTSAEDLVAALKIGLATQGPYLIEARIP